MRVGILGTGAIADKHAQAYRNIGFEIAACYNHTAHKGREFAVKWGTQFVAEVRELCHFPGLDFVDVCSFPDFRLEPVRLCAEIGRHVQVQKPIATDMKTALAVVRVARRAGIKLNVVSQHRFDEAVSFLKRAIADGRLGRILQADAYVKWYRSAEYYARPIKGSWEGEGGGALINQGIHQVDLLLWLAGGLESVVGQWQLGAIHTIESEDVVNALLQYGSGATGTIQASTAFWPGYSERIELHGTNGTAVMTGDALTTWDICDSQREGHLEPAPVASSAASGANDPMAIGVASFERQFLDFASAIRGHREPLVNGEEGCRALQAVLSIYESCRTGKRVYLEPLVFDEEGGRL